MKTSKIAAILIILSSISLSAEMDPEDLIKLAKKKYNAKQDEISNITVNVSASLKGLSSIEAGMTWYFKGDKFRLENSMMGISTMQIYDGDKFWIISPLTGKQKIAQAAFRRGKYLLKRDWWNENFGNLVVTGEEYLDPAECYTLEDKSKTGSNYYMWIDKNTLLMAKDRIAGKGTNLVNVYSDYRNFEEKLLMPFTTETTTNNLFTMTTAVKDVDIKTKIDDGVFDAEKIEVKEDKGMLEELKKLMNMK